MPFPSHPGSVGFRALQGGGSGLLGQNPGCPGWVICAVEPTGPEPTQLGMSPGFAHEWLGDFGPIALFL